MSNQLQKTLAARVTAVVSAVMLLWLTVCFGLLTVICIAMGAYSESQLSYDAFLAETYYDDSAYTENYLASYVRAVENNNTERITLMQKHFSPEATNLRFIVTDDNGEVIVSNNTGLTEDSALASMYTDLYLTINQSRYKVEKVFSSYNEIVNTNLAQFLQAQNDYSYWYFTEDVVTAAYQHGMYVTIQDLLLADTLTFPDRATAENYDYPAHYGPDAIWKIIEEAQTETNVTGIDGSATQSPSVKVEVWGVSNAEETMISLGEYYEMQSPDRSIIIRDESLAQALDGGIDVTIVGEPTVTAHYDVCLYLPHELTANDAYAANIRLGNILFDHRYLFLGGVFVLLLLAITAMIALCKVAGYVFDREEPVCGWTHRVPYELLLGICVLAVGGIVLVLGELSYMGFSWMGDALLVGGLMLCASALAIFMLYTTAVRVKTHHFWDGFFTVRVIRFVYHLCCNRMLACILLIMGAAFLFMINVLILPDIADIAVVLLILMIDGWAMLGAAYCIYAFEMLRQYAKRMEQGDFSEPKLPIPLIGVFRKYANSLMKINEGIGVAVAKQTKAERMRTALITNVSHDLKTPLTSIVNYVDLMKREPIDNPAVAEYLAVLDRQSARLKKLTEDLVEASKASTGNITVDLQPTNVQVLVEQLMGEYESRFAAGQLTTVVNLPEENLYIAADGRLIWRVFDNLLGNISKYAMAGTRVYFDVIRQKNGICFTLRNISESALHLSPDELTERFVRGDESRNTEGSGLGLSIAKDLIRLQNGLLQLQIDGDLFKAVVTLPEAAPPVYEGHDGGEQTES